MLYVHDQGLPVKEAASLLQINLRTAFGILKTFENENRIEPKEQKGRAPKFGKTFMRFVREFFCVKRPDATLIECQSYIKAHPEQFSNLCPSISSLDRMCRKQKLSLKRISVVPKARNSPSTIKMRKHYVVRLNSALGEGKTPIFLDEMGCNLHTRRRFGRNTVGKPATISVPTGRGHNLSICAAISADGLVHQRSKFLAYNQVEFEIFLNEMYAKLAPDKQYVVIMDNVRFHKTPAITAWFALRDNLEQLFLPPYSPFLNAIEEANAKVHHLICQARPSASNSLIAAVKRAWESITPENCAGWISHTRKYHSQCIYEQPILKEADPSCMRFRVVEGDTSGSESERESESLAGGDSDSDELLDFD